MEIKENDSSKTINNYDNSYQEPLSNEIFSLNMWITINVLFCKNFYLS